MKATWGTEQREVTFLDDLLAVVDAARRVEPTMVFLEAANGNWLVFGVGHSESVLTFMQPERASFHSLGDIHRKGYLRFRSHDHVDEFMLEMAVPESLALQAATEFLTTQERPSCIRWEDDCA